MRCLRELASGTEADMRLREARVHAEMTGQRRFFGENWGAVGIRAREEQEVWRTTREKRQSTLATSRVRG